MQPSGQFLNITGQRRTQALRLVPASQSPTLEMPRVPVPPACNPFSIQHPVHHASIAHVARLQLHPGRQHGIVARQAIRLVAAVCLGSNAAPQQPPSSSPLLHAMTAPCQRPHETVCAILLTDIAKPHRSASSLQASEHGSTRCHRAFRLAFSFMSTLALSRPR
jgi:hypothetical protein